MRGRTRVAAACAVIGVLVALPAALAGQDTPATRSAVTVDYVGADGIYLPVGADQGFALGDTVPVFPDSVTTTPSGSLVFTSVTRRRSVALGLGAAGGLRTGDVVFVVTSTSDAVSAAAPVTATVAAGQGTRINTARAAGSGPRVSGRISLDFDARETRTSWTGDLFGETTRRFATPTTRLSLVATELPGGFTVRTNLRASYRYDELQSGPPPVSVRAYEVVAVKAFDAAPVEIMLGRFSNPYESYSAYWDGLLLRVGRSRGPGLGVVAGFEPSLYNERFSTALPKLTGFADLALRGDGWRYDTDVSVHVLRPTDGADWSYVGWSQRIALGPVDLSQRLRVDGGLDGRTLELGDLRLRAGLDIPGPLGLHGTYGRTGQNAARPGATGDDVTAPITFVPREEVSAGLDVSGHQGSLWVDAGQSRREDESAGRFVSGNSSLSLGGARLLVSGRYWWEGDSRSLGASPGLAFDFAGIDWSASYRHYRTESPSSTITTHAADLRVGMRLGQTLRLTAIGEHQWGSNLQGDRVHIGISRSF